MKTNLLEQEKIRLMPWLGLRCQSQKENIPRRRVGRTKITREAYLSSVSNSMCRNKWVKVSQSCPTLPPHGILQARILEWVAFPLSRGSFWPKDPIQVSCIAGRFFILWTITILKKKYSIRLQFGKQMIPLKLWTKLIDNVSQAPAKKFNKHICQAMYSSLWESHGDG